MEPDDKELADRLVKERLITEEQLKIASNYITSLGTGRLRDILVKLGFVKDAVLDGFIGDQMRVAAIDLAERRIAVWAMELIPRKVIEKHQVLPLVPQNAGPKDEGTLVLAMCDPDNFAAVEEIQFLTNCRVETALATRAAVKKAINQYFNLVEQGDAGVRGNNELPEKIFSAYPTDELLRALIQTLASSGTLDREAFLARLKKMGARKGRARYRSRA